MIEEQLQSQLNKAKLDKYILVFDLPPVFKKLDTTSLSQRGNEIVNKSAVQFSVYGNVIPDISVPAHTAGYAGQTFKVSSHTRPAYPAVTVNYTIDNRYNNYWVMYKWLDILNDSRDSFFDAKYRGTKITPPEYQTTFTLYAKDEFDKNVMKFTFTKVFPTLVSGINFSDRTADDIESTFTFEYSQFFAEPI